LAILTSGLKSLTVEFVEFSDCTALSKLFTDNTFKSLEFGTSSSVMLTSSVTLGGRVYLTVGKAFVSLFSSSISSAKSSLVGTISSYVSMVVGAGVVVVVATV
jgi:hypothetical protein